jgi:hypothetical protein
MREGETAEHLGVFDLIGACGEKDRGAICRLIEVIPAECWEIVPGRATCFLDPLTVQVWHISGGSGINTYETVCVSILAGNEICGEEVRPLFVGEFTSVELRLPNYIPKEARRPPAAGELRT